MFSKANYWKRRKDGKRGQGDEPETKVISKGFGTNRANYRQKLRSKYHENENDVAGKPYTAKGVPNAPRKKLKFELTLDPTMSNHTRHGLRKQRRQMILEDQRKENAKA